jgi:hypothetical protein
MSDLENRSSGPRVSIKGTEIVKKTVKKFEAANDNLKPSTEEERFEKDFNVAFEEELAKPEPKQETWEDQIAALTAEAKRTAEERPHLKNTSQPNTLDLEDRKTNMSEVLGAMRSLPLNEWVSRQLTQNNAKQEYLADKDLMLKLEKTLQGMKPSALMEIGIASGDLKKISPDDRIDPARMNILIKRSIEENKNLQRKTRSWWWPF